MTDPREYIRVPNAMLRSRHLTAEAKGFYADLRACDDDLDSITPGPGDYASTESLLEELEQAGWVDVEVLPSGALSVTTRDEQRS